LENEQKYKDIKNEILGSDDESGEESGSESDSEDEEGGYYSPLAVQLTNHFASCP
jgi:hypothetical protein